MKGLHNNKLINTELSKDKKEILSGFFLLVHLNSTLFTHVMKTALNFDPPINFILISTHHSRLHQSPLLEKQELSTFKLPKN
jgi:hypothetical protein